MMEALLQSLAERFSNIVNVAVSVVANDIPDDDGGASIIVKFANGARLKATYWRMISGRRVAISSFDHKQKYGLPEEIDAKNALRRILEGRVCLSAIFDEEIADIALNFAEGAKLQVFSFTGYEVWEMTFPDGTGEYSNYAVAPLQSVE